MKLDTLLFDFDGTLQFGDKLELVAKLEEIVRRLDIKILSNELREISDSTSDFREMREQLLKIHNNSPLREYLISQEQFDKTTKEVSGMFDNLFYLEDGVRQTLDYFKERNYKLGLVSTRGNNSLNRLINDIHKIEHFFDVVISRDDCKERKPNPAPILLALEKLDSKPEQALYVGDNQKEDVGAAQNAKVMSVLKSYGPINLEEGYPIPNCKIKRFMEIPSLLVYHEQSVKSNI